MRQHKYPASDVIFQRLHLGEIGAPRRMRADGNRSRLRTATEQGFDGISLGSKFGSGRMTLAHSLARALPHGRTPAPKHMDGAGRCRHIPRKLGCFFQSGLEDRYDRLCGERLDQTYDGPGLAETWRGKDEVRRGRIRRSSFIGNEIKGDARDILHQLLHDPGHLRERSRMPAHVQKRRQRVEAGGFAGRIRWGRAALFNRRALLGSRGDQRRNLWHHLVLDRLHDLPQARFAYGKIDHALTPPGRSCPFAGLCPFQKLPVRQLLWSAKSAFRQYGVATGPQSFQPEGHQTIIQVREGNTRGNDQNPAATQEQQGFDVSCRGMVLVSIEGEMA